MKRASILAPLLLLMACSAEPEAPAETQATATATPTATAPFPDLARCDAAHQPSEGYTFGDEPVSVPSEFAPVLAASAIEFAVLTQSGGTICHSLAWISAFESVEWLEDERLLGIQHAGYESYGYFLIDRADPGNITDSGARPVFSPDGRLLASLQISEAGWGGMEGFAVWELTPTSLRELSRQSAEAENDWTLPAPLDTWAHDWRIDGWRGNDCIDMSAIPWDTEPPFEELAERTGFFASKANAWRVREGSCP